MSQLIKKKLCLGCKNYLVENSRCKKFSITNNSANISNRTLYADATEIRKHKCGIDEPKFYIPIKQELKEKNYFQKMLYYQPERFSKIVGLSLLFVGSNTMCCSPDVAAFVSVFSYAGLYVQFIRAIEPYSQIQNQIDAIEDFEQNQNFEKIENLKKNKKLKK